MFGTETLFNRYDTKSHTFTNTNRKYRRSNGSIDSDNTTNKNRTGIVRKTRSNEIKNSIELDNSSFYDIIKLVVVWI